MTRNRTVRTALSAGSVVAFLLLTPFGVRAQGGAYLVEDIQTAPAGSRPYDLVRADGRLFFFANGLDGLSLWRSDGTPGGTVPVENRGEPLVDPRVLTDVNGTLFFVDGEAIRRSDGNEIAAVPVFTGSVSQLISVDGTLFFTTADASGSPSQLWRSDGTAAGTRQVASLSITRPIDVNGTLFFIGDDGSSGTELWRSDGTQNGTRRVKDINPNGNALPSSRPLTAVGGMVFFFADSGSGSFDLWHSDGTEEGTLRVKELGVSTAPESGHSNGLFFFPLGADLWRSDGTEIGTIELVDLSTRASAGVDASFVDVNGTLFVYVRLGPDSSLLWRSDGTPEGTILIRELPLSNFVAGEPADDGSRLLLFSHKPDPRVPIEWAL